MTHTCELDALCDAHRRDCLWGGILMVREILSEKLANFASTLKLASYLRLRKFCKDATLDTATAGKMNSLGMTLVRHSL